MYRTILIIASLSCWVLGCSSPNPTSSYNEIASLQASDTLQENPLQWKVVTTLINRKNRSMSTLYGNDAAVAYARQHADAHYPAGAKLALVTWQQQEDAHWFGAHIPGKIRAVEVITFSTNGSPQYDLYEGKPLHKIAQQEPARVAVILSYRASVVPGE